MQPSHIPIKIASSATVLSTSDPVRVYEDFATLDLISNGRAEIVAGRGSRLGAYELLGFDVSNYEELFEEKLALLLKINEEERVTAASKRISASKQYATKNEICRC